MNNSISFNVSKRLNNKNSKFGKCVYNEDFIVSRTITRPIKEIIKTNK